MIDFFRMFFGQGTEPEFALFTPAHIIPILLLILAIFLLTLRYSGDVLLEAILDGKKIR